MKIIDIKNIKKYFRKRGVFSDDDNIVKAVDDVSFSVKMGETFGLVGESGCGKTTLARTIAGIERQDSGTVLLSGERDIVFQDPDSSLNPRMKIRDIIGETLLIRGEKRSQVDESVYEVLRMVRLEKNDIFSKYPHQFSGGERQRIAIARAIIRKPDIVILDEPVSSLDVSVQAGILNLLKDLQEDLGLTYLFISHDLRVVEFMSDHVGIMKNGKIIEIAGAKEIYSSPKEAYTRQLLGAIPKL